MMAHTVTGRLSNLIYITGTQLKNLVSSCKIRRVRGIFLNNFYEKLQILALEVTQGRPRTYDR